MSIKALDWAFEKEVFSSSQKFVLVALANYASDTGKAYPQVATICSLTQLHDETVRSALAKLVESGIIKDSGLRAGPTQQVKVYQLPDEACKKTPENRGLKKDKARRRPGEDPAKTPEKPGQSLEPGTSNQRQRKPEPALLVEIPLLLNDPLFKAVWSEWVADRRERRKPLTSRAAKEQLNELVMWGVKDSIEGIKSAIRAGYLQPYRPKHENENNRNGHQQVELLRGNL